MTRPLPSAYFRPRRTFEPTSLCPRWWVRDPSSATTAGVRPRAGTTSLIQWLAIPGGFETAPKAPRRLTDACQPRETSQRRCTTHTRRSVLRGYSGWFFCTAVALAVRPLTACRPYVELNIRPSKRRSRTLSGNSKISQLTTFQDESNVVVVRQMSEQHLSFMEHASNDYSV